MRLGMKGGHPTECVRLDRKKANHTYVFLVRMLRIGCEPAAPKEEAPVFLGDFKMDPGVVYPLQIDTEIKIGEATLFFRVVEESDWETS